jgi:hypothetical protein
MRNILDKIKKADRPAAKRVLRKVMNAGNAAEARTAARRFKERFEDKYPAAVACLRNDLDELLTCFRYKSADRRKAVRTTNAIERRFREVRVPVPWAPSRTRPPWIASYSPSSPTKTNHRASAPPSADTEQLTLPGAELGPYS